ncbi:MAG: ribonuclease D [Alphaproteobacteria bacterium]|nr:MAG: ribonuclease D [Alphaproteobacteria bacterium]
MTLITTSKDLKSLCTRLKKADFVTVDTEFIREKTYWPHLCLIQVAGQDDEAYAIDPLAEDMDLEPFYELMQNKEVLKVFHACRQDLEIFFNEGGKLPTPIFDTQVAAMVCGYGEQVSYEVLVNSILKKHLDKSSRFTDWAQRPLTSKQLKYALADVTHLRKIFLKLAERIENLERTSWIRDEMKKLSNKENYINRPEDAWERIKLPNHKQRTLCIVKELAAWRETMAQAVDVPRGRILKDEAISEIAAHPPTTKEALGKMRNVNHGFAESARGDEVLEAVKRGMEMEESDGPQREPRTQLPPGLAPTIDLLRVLLKLKCEENEVAPKLLCSAADLELIAGFGKEAKVAAMSGWRFKVFGKEALELRDGKLAMAVENGKLKLVKTAEVAAAE